MAVDFLAVVSFLPLDMEDFLETGVITGIGPLRLNFNDFGAEVDVEGGGASPGFLTVTVFSFGTFFLTTVGVWLILLLPLMWLLPHVRRLVP